MSRPASLEFLDATHVRVRGRSLAYFAGTNYLGLSRHPRLLAAMRAALEGMLHPGASRTTTGEHTAYSEAERALADFFKQPASAMLAAGYLAPMAAFQALGDGATHVLLDDAAHVCVRDGAAVSGLPVKRFAHANPEALARLLARLPTGARPIVACDGLLGARGTITPLPQYLELLPREGWLLVDDAHGAGTMGPGGRGTTAAFGLKDRRILQSLSLSKAFGLQGGVVLGPRKIVERLKRGAGAFAGNTSPLLHVAAAIVEATRILDEEPSHLERLRRNIATLNKVLPAAEGEIFHDTESPVLTILPRSVQRQRRLRQELLRAGVFPSWIRYASGPATGFYRFAIASGHTSGEVEQLGTALTRSF